MVDPVLPPALHCARSCYSAAMNRTRSLLLLLKILLDRCVILLCTRNVAVLQVLRKRRERLRDRVRTTRRRALRVREVLCQRRVILLRLSQISGLQILPQLLKLTL